MSEVEKVLAKIPNYIEARRLSALADERVALAEAQRVWREMDKVLNGKQRWADVYPSITSTQVIENLTEKGYKVSNIQTGTNEESTRISW